MFTVSRALTATDELFDAWRRRGRGHMPLHLGSFLSQADAVSACEASLANGGVREG